MVDTAGVILAGGQSSRMGEDKAALSLHGKTLLEHMQALLAKAGINPVYISREDAIADRIPGYGPLSGIHAILSHVGNRHDRLLFVPVDMPGLTPTLLRQLADAPDTPLVRFERYMLPFRLRWNADCLAAIETMLAAPADVSLKAFQATVPLLELPIEPKLAPCFANMNTLEEWQEFTKERVQ